MGKSTLVQRIVSGVILIAVGIGRLREILTGTQPEPEKKDAAGTQ